MVIEGLVTIRSTQEPGKTMDRVKAEVTARGMTVFLHIDHKAGAGALDLPLPATDLLIFGTAKAGTKLMQTAQSIGIDLPLKALVWQDESGATWLSYNDPAWLAQRHGLAATAKPAIAAMSAALQAIAAAATGPENALR